MTTLRVCDSQRNMFQRISSLARPNRVRVFAAEDVTTIAEDEAPASAGGLETAQIDAIWDAAVRYYKTGLQPSVSLCIRRNGAKVLDRAIGHARGNTTAGIDDDELRLATPDTVYNLFSASKSVTAMLIHHLDECGKLHIDDAVCEYIPEFGANGKERITIRHVLNHRAGLPLIDAEHFDLDALGDASAVLNYLYNAEPASVPGRKLAYHAITGGFILGEIVRRVTGKDIQTYHNETIRQPLGMRSFAYGIPPEDIGEIARDVWTGPPAVFPLSRLVRKAFGGDMQTIVNLANDPRFLHSVVPSGNICGTAEEAGRYFECLLRGGEYNGTRVFSERSVKRARLEQNYHEYDGVLQYPFRYGLGFMLGSDHSSVIGPDTPDAFGHIGFTNILIYADPERDISVALLNNGKPLIAVESLWWLNLSRTIAKVIPKL